MHCATPWTRAYGTSAKEVRSGNRGARAVGNGTPSPLSPGRLREGTAPQLAPDVAGLTQAASEPLLAVRDLHTYFFTPDGVVRAVDGVDLTVHRGSTLCLVGESGCGKSVTALSIMRLIPYPPGRIVRGQVLFNGYDLLRLPEAEMVRMRGKSISMIFQEPMTSLNPVFRVGEQVAEAVLLHERVSHRQAWERAVEMLRLVGIPAPE
ncbi:MAG: hypothetical protein C4289_14355, partial [Chloroflexota bacterium]